MAARAMCVVRGMLATAGAALVGWGTLAASLLALDFIWAAFARQWPGISIVFAIGAAPFWFVGASVAAVVWIAAHLMGRRTRRDAIMAGAVLCAVAHPLVWFGLAPGSTSDLQGLAALAVWAVVGAISGGVAGRTLHILFYEPEPGHA